MKRHNARILAMMTLYQNDIIEHSKFQELLNSEKIVDLSRYQEMEEELANIEIDEEFYNLLLNGTRENLASIDTLIESSLVNWPLNRLSFVDRAIIRLATFEMLYTETPKEIVIDEALLITREYVEMDDFPAVKFNNKVLDTIKEKIING